MPFVYRGEMVTPFPADAVSGNLYYKIVGTGFRKDYGSKAAVMERLRPVANDMPLGTDVAVEKVYHMRRGYEPDALFRHGDIAEKQVYRLMEHGTWYDPQTGKPREPKWKLVSQSKRKSSLAPWESRGDAPSTGRRGYSGSALVASLRAEAAGRGSADMRVSRSSRRSRSSRGSRRRSSRRSRPR